MTVSALIIESDWLRLRAALRHMDEISLERSLGAVRVLASTARVKKAWPVAMVVGLAVAVLVNENMADQVGVT